MKLGDIVLVDGYEFKVYSLPNNDGDMKIILDEGLYTEFIYDCNINDINLCSDGCLVLTTENIPTVGDTIHIDSKEFKLLDIEENIVTLKRDYEYRYYYLDDIHYDIIDGYWISTISQQVMSPTVRRKLEVYKVQDGVYSYNSLEELKEIHTLLDTPRIEGSYGLYTYNCINTFIDSLQCEYGLVHYWEDYDSDYDYMYKYIKVIQGATFIEEYL